MPELRPRQQAGKEAIRSAFRRGARGVLYVAPWGFGKTYLMASIAADSQRRGTRIVFVAHRRELVRQISDALTAWGVPHGVIAPGLHPTEHSVQVARVLSLVRRQQRHGLRFDFVFVDEAHHAVGNSGWGLVLQHNASAWYLGVTATPCRLDGRGLGRHVGGYFDSMVLGPTPRELVEEGWLVRPTVYQPPPGSMPDMRGVRRRGGDYVTEQLAAAFDRAPLTGDAIAHYRRHCNGQPAMAFTVNVRHAEHVAAQFRASGYRALALSGETPDRERDAMIRGLATGEVQLVASCGVISEGVDVPPVRAAFLLRRTASFSVASQQMGRAMRIWPGKDRALIFDHAGNTVERRLGGEGHGLPTDDIEWSLDGGAKRASIGSGVKQCPVCFAAAPPGARKCKECGHLFGASAPELELPQTVDADLIAIDALAESRHRRMEEGMCRTLEELQELGRHRKYSPSWAWMRWKARQGKTGRRTA